MNKIQFNFLIFIFISINSISQTLIVFIDNGRSVYIGADSKMTYMPMGNFRSVCKIIALDKRTVYFSVGVHEISFVNFYIDSIIRNSFKGDSLFDKTNNVTLKIREQLKISLLVYKNKDSIQYHQFMTKYSGNRFMEIVFCGIEEKNLKTYYCRFNLNDSLIIREYITNIGFKKERILLGDIASITPMPDESYFNRPPKKIINELITRVSKISPYVGLPINIIKINKNGIHWVQNCNCK